MTPRSLFKLVWICAFGAAACAEAPLDEAVYTHEMCRRVALDDQLSGATIIGAEDIAYDREENRFFISAYDRRKTERAARNNRLEPPQGGLYEVSAAALFDTDQTRINVVSLIDSNRIAGGLRPHGIDFDADKKELLFINRAYEKAPRGWRMRPSLMRIGANGELFVGPTIDTHCAANDVLVSGEGHLVSFTHGACNWRRAVENIFTLQRSGLIANDGRVLFKSAAYANGVAQSTELLGLAATRENALILFEADADRLVEAGRIKLPGGPDNLTLNANGEFIAALHPNLFRLALNRKWGLGRAPSRIMRAAPASEQTTLLFEDRAGALFSAATVGVETADGLILGSVTDSGLLVCLAEKAVGDQ